MEAGTCQLLVESPAGEQGSVRVRDLEGLKEAMKDGRWQYKLENPGLLVIR